MASVTRWVDSVRAWVEMPRKYSAAEITAEDVREDGQMRIVAWPCDTLRGEDADEFSKQTGIAIDSRDENGVAWLTVPDGKSVQVDAAQS